MRTKRHSKFHKLFLVLPLAAITALGLYGASHAYGGGWHSHERMEKKMNWIQEDLAEELEIRPEQQEAYQALAEAFKSQAREWKAGWLEAGAGVKAEFDQEAPDAEKIGALMKARIRNRPSNETLENLVEQSVGFYKTLNPEQQELFKEKVLKHLNRHF